ncbi:MAG: HAMP domain-containing sensor histidine kinase [Phycisphaerae bacterium]
MTATRLIWPAFALSVLVLIAALFGVSRTLLRLDLAETEASHRATTEENVRLALWRMDLALSPLIAAERARPYFAYQPFYRAADATPASDDEAMGASPHIASPLLTTDSPYVRLYFEITPAGGLVSPLTPEEPETARRVTDFATPGAIDAARRSVAALGERLTYRQLAAAIPTDPPEAAPAVAQAPAQVMSQQGEPQSPQLAQSMRNVTEYQARENAYRQQMQAGQQSKSNAMPELTVAAPPAREGWMHAIWLGDALLLVRRVEDGEQRLQGCWLNWETLRPWLLERVRDLAPSATLEPAPPTSPDARERLLAGLPIRLQVAPEPHEPTTIRPQTAFALASMWAAALLAVLALGMLVVGTQRLSDRRAAFVSAVTHELRTPLTTFRLLTEMLSSGMVRDDVRQREYLATLNTESQRLGHLVENVLAYARLERTRPTKPLESLSLAALIGRVRERLEARAAQAQLAMSVCVEAPDAQVRADALAIEQILMNLVDNACKYASRAENRTIEIRALSDRQSGILAVRDFGPGIDAATAARLFRPFHKSARQGAENAPGVGLGLALSRRLARAMGGDLSWAPARPGVCFTLRLPLAAA